MKNPKLRIVDKYGAPYPLNKFPKGFAVNLGKEIVYFLASRGEPRLEGPDWEKIFASLIGAHWKPSNVGLDDIIYGQTAWGAKTVKNTNPFKAKNVRLISGRNSLVYSFGEKEIRKGNPNDLGQKVLAIWNARVAEVKASFKNLRTVVLIKSNDLLELAVYEFQTKEFDPKNYQWTRNKNKNLVGSDIKTKEHIFTWQPHGSQFTIIEKVPQERLAIRIKKPPKLDKNEALKAIKFDDSWIQIIK
jgi:hypothetical protein